MQLNAPQKTLIATSIAHFVNDGSLYIFITLYSKLFPQQSEYLLIGILGALQNTFSVAVSPLVGRKADASRNYAMMLSLGLVLIGVGIVGYSISALLFRGFTLFLFLIPFAVTAGIGSCFYHPIGAAAMHMKWTGKKMGRAMGINGSMGSLGRAIYPLFTITLVIYLTVPSVGVLAAVTFVSASLILSVMRGIQFGEEPGLSGETRTKDESIRKAKNSSVPLGLILPRILGLTIIALGRSILSQGIVYFIPSYITKVLKVTFGFELGTMFALMLGMAVIGQPVFGSLADRLGRRTTLGVSIVGSSAALLLFLNTDSIVLATALLAVFGFFVFTGFPLLMPLATSVVPEGAGVMSGSIVWGMGTVGGGAIGPFLVGLLAQPILLGSLSSAFFVIGAIALASLAILPFVPKSSEAKAVSATVKK